MKIRLPYFVRFLAVGLFAVSSLWVGSTVSAQTPVKGTITGVLSDSEGRPVGGARIVATAKGAPLKQAPAAETQSQDDGSFALELPPGKYSVVITRESFTKIDRDIELAAGQKVEWKMSLEIEPLAASVVVTA